MRARGRRRRIATPIAFSLALAAFGIACAAATGPVPRRADDADGRLRLEVTGLEARPVGETAQANGDDSPRRRLLATLHRPDGGPVGSLDEERALLVGGVEVRFFALRLDASAGFPRSLRVVHRAQPTQRHRGSEARAARFEFSEGGAVVAAPPAWTLPVERSSGAAETEDARGARTGLAVAKLAGLEERDASGDELVVVDAREPGRYLLAFAAGRSEALRHFDKAFAVPWDAAGPLRANVGESRRQGLPPDVLVPEVPYRLGLGTMLAWRAQLVGDPSDRVELAWLANRLAAAQDENGLWRYDYANDFLRTSFRLPMRQGFYDDRTTSAAVRVLLEADRLDGRPYLRLAARRAADAYLSRFPRLRSGTRSIPYAYMSPESPGAVTIVALNRSWDAVGMLLDVAAALDEGFYRAAALDILDALADFGSPNMPDGRFWYGIVPGRLGVALSFRDAEGEDLGRQTHWLDMRAEHEWTHASISAEAPDGATEMTIVVYRGQPGRGGALVRELRIESGEQQYRHRLDSLDGLAPWVTPAQRVEVVAATGGTEPALRIGSIDSDASAGFAIWDVPLGARRVDVSIDVAADGPIGSLWGPSPYQDLETVELEMIRARLSSSGAEVPRWIDRALDSVGRWASGADATHPTTGKRIAEMVGQTTFSTNVFARTSGAFFRRLSGIESRGVETLLGRMPRLEWAADEARAAATFGDVAYFRGVRHVTDGPLDVEVSPKSAISLGRSERMVALVEAQLKMIDCGGGRAECALAVAGIAEDSRVVACALGGVVDRPAVAAAQGWRHREAGKACIELRAGPDAAEEVRLRLPARGSR